MYAIHASLHCGNSINCYRGGVSKMNHWRRSRHLHHASDRLGHALMSSPHDGSRHNRSQQSGSGDSARSAPSPRSANKTWEDWLGKVTSTFESSDYQSMGMSKQRAVGGKNFQLNYPFTRLACFDEDVHDKAVDQAFATDFGAYHVMMDSSRLGSLSSADSQDLSRKTSLQSTSSIGSLGSLGSINGISRASLVATAQDRMSLSIAGDTIAEEEVAEGEAGEPKAAMPIMLPDLNEGGWAQIEKSNRSTRSKSLPISELLFKKGTAPVKVVKTDAKAEPRWRLLSPLASLNVSKAKKHRNKANCKWDMFPGIQQDPEKMNVPFSKAYSGDKRQLKYLMSPFRRSKARRSGEPWPFQGSSHEQSSSLDRSQTFEHNTNGSVRSVDSDLIKTGDDESASSFPSGEQMATQLDHTFGHGKLKALESMARQQEQHETISEEPVDDNSADSGEELESRDTWQEQVDKGKREKPVPQAFMSQPFMIVVEKIKTAIPPSLRPKTDRSFSEPQLHTSTSFAKQTAKLRVEKFGGITFINEFALVRTLGKGSFGTVKLALNTQDHNLCALKLLPKSRKARSHRSSLQADADVLREIELMKQLDHPNIVRLLEVIDDPENSKMLMVLEHAQGGALFSGSKITPKIRLSEVSARRYFRDVLTGLDYLFLNKIAHGDLKPDNLLLSANGHVKIADFGSSQLLRRGEVVKRTSGTPAFMAPELCSGQAYHARLADIWALGVCLYMFVFGALPFRAKSILGLYEAIQTQPVEFPDDIFVSDSLKHLILRLLDKNPETRMSLAGAMHHPWTTHNGSFPLANLQGLEDDEEEDGREFLMECWSDNPCNVNLGNILQAVAPLFEIRKYQDGAYLARQGEPVKCVFYIQKGEAVISHTLTKEGSDSEDSASGEETEKLKRLKRAGTMLKTMYRATITASQLVSAVRDYANGEPQLISVRKSGHFVGEVQFYAKGLEATWQTTVRAKGPVTTLVMQYQQLRDVVKRRPEAETDVRAGTAGCHWPPLNNDYRSLSCFVPVVMAQRQSELTKLTMLEKLASLHRELSKELQFATSEGGVSVSSARIAEDLLARTSHDDFFKIRNSGGVKKVQIGDLLPVEEASQASDPGQKGLDHENLVEKPLAQGEGSSRQNEGESHANTDRGYLDAKEDPPKSPGLKA